MVDVVVSTSLCARGWREAAVMAPSWQGSGVPPPTHGQRRPCLRRDPRDLETSRLFSLWRPGTGGWGLSGPAKVDLP